ncbi:MAG TPA: LPS export ABC transporter periplasmic protein LptC [Croceibacterium sp.]|nr:LPS export ABC transporter periplasmic protein LptC [Croceibacterium sp.]
MSQQADQIRNRRRAFAYPGGRLDKAVKLLAVLLPALVGAIAAVMLIAPLGPRGEVSFLLDRNKVDTAAERLRVDDAMYRGRDNAGRPFSVTAGNAVQRSASVPVVQLSDLTARMLLSGGPAVLTAPAGRFHTNEQQLAVDGTVRFATADGYRMSVRNVSVDLPARTVTGSGGVEGTVPAGTFSANTIRADLDERIVALQGNARLRMVPGLMRAP